MSETMDDLYQQQRNQAWQSRWNTGSGSPHSNSLLTWFEYYGKKPSPGVLQKYLDDLSHVKLEELDAVLKDLDQTSNTAFRKMPLVSEILASWRQRSKRRDQKIAEARKQRSKISKGEKEQAKQAVQFLFAQKFWKSISLSVSLPKPSYSGGFDVPGFVAELDLPPEQYNKHAHTACYQTLDQKFDEAWRSYVE